MPAPERFYGGAPARRAPWLPVLGFRRLDRSEAAQRVSRLGPAIPRGPPDIVPQTDSALQGQPRPVRLRPGLWSPSRPSGTRSTAVAPPRGLSTTRRFLSCVACADHTSPRGLGVLRCQRVRTGRQPVAPLGPSPRASSTGVSRAPNGYLSIARGPTQGTQAPFSQPTAAT